MTEKKGKYRDDPPSQDDQLHPQAQNKLQLECDAMIIRLRQAFEDLLRRLWGTADAQQPARWRADIQRQLNDLSNRLKSVEDQVASFAPENARLTQEASELDRRLSIAMAQAATADRGSLSITGSHSQPDRVRTEFLEFRDKVGEIVKKTRAADDSRGLPEYRPLGTSALSRLIAEYGERLWESDESHSDMFEPSHNVCREFWRAVHRVSEPEATINEELRTVVVSGFELVRRVRFATLPVPGNLVFVDSGVRPDLELHEIWPTSSDGQDAVVKLTVFPGYQVGKQIYVKPTVFAR